ncbi:MAG: GTPase ObgE [Clostridia bacterium]|jgi:GTP-binding protein|nr:GTPase ObgE [Clostridia bacterium]
MFLDRTKIIIKAGNGGNGSASFLHTAQTANGGPDGGEGGKGGDVVFVATKDLNTLYDFRFHKKFFAENGNNGGQRLKTGAKGADKIIKVPCGTVLIDNESGKIIADLYEDGMRFIALKGGEGGHGNAYYKSSIKQAPHFSQSGEETKSREVILELKTIADVGLVGFPNAGKSTLLSCISNANPKIANYPFTTLYPNLGVCEVKGQTFVVADIPGIIKGASDGQGLGHYFLKHVERVRLLLHLVDISQSDGRDFIEDFHVINKELALYSHELTKTPQIVLLSKVDLLDEETLNSRIDRYKKEVGGECMLISGATYKGIDEVKLKVLELLSKIPKKPPLEIEKFDFDAKDKVSIIITRDDEGAFVVSGGKIDEFARGIVLSDTRSFAYFQKRLETMGIIDMLKERGLKNGSTIKIKDAVFEYTE